MTTYSYTVTFNDIQVIDLTNMINEKIKTFEEKHGDSLPVPYWWIDILDKLNNAHTELRSHTSFLDVNLKPHDAYAHDTYP